MDIRIAQDLFTLVCEIFHTCEYRVLFLIREFDEKVHLAGVRACLIELQNFERSIDPRLPSGAEIVDDLVPRMMFRCASCDGVVLVAELSEAVIGFVTILAKVRGEEIEEGDFEYGLVSDVFVTSKYRNQGIGRKLLEAAESYAKSKGVRWLRIGVLAENHSADGLYDSIGFKRLFIEREKELTGS